ncbi:MAG: hypothetical protein MN733_31495 [Nitrososphaera sp.]|nr:hypothetical protein [Nitrososphaera sp.]
MKVKTVIICAASLAASVAMMPARATQTSTHYECNQYAEKAIQQYKENLDRGCNYAGARWDGNYDTHYQWCLSVRGKYSRYNAETQARKNDLSSCHASSLGGRIGGQVGGRR